MGGGGFMLEMNRRIKENLKKLGKKSFWNSGSSSFKFKDFTLYNSEEEMLKSEQKDLEHLREKLNKKSTPFIKYYWLFLVISFFLFIIIAATCAG